MSAVAVGYSEEAYAWADAFIAQHPAAVERNELAQWFANALLTGATLERSHGWTLEAFKPLASPSNSPNKK